MKTWMMLGLLLQPLSSAAAELNVEVLSAVVKDQHIDGATAILQKNGERSVQATTDAKGRVKFAAIPGGSDADSVHLIVKKDGYSDLVVKCPCNGLSYAMSPNMTNLDGMRIVLNWGAEPRDLDSHLVWPGNHVYFSSKQGDQAKLDVDDTDGFGPETITLQTKKPGVRYVYAVNNYSENAREGSSLLSNSSQAKVFVYVGTSLVRTFVPPRGRTGNTWVVFAIGENGEFYDLNTFFDTNSNGVNEGLATLLNAPNLASTPVRAADGKAVADAVNTQGEAAYHAGDTDGSVRLYLEAINLDPEHAQAYSNLGLAYLKLGKDAEAIWANRKAIALASGPTASTVQASSHYNIAKVYERRADWTGALGAYEQANRLKPAGVYQKGIAAMKAKLGQK